MNNLPIFFENPHVLAGKNQGDILVGLSGGADSVCLLHILCEYAKNNNCKIYAAHINHNIRTDEYANEALRDENFCRKLCEKLSVELFVASIDIPCIAKTTKQSIEGAAREARYTFFSDIMNEKGIKILALAHNADDNLETQLFNLCRGASVSGMIGIKRARDISNISGGRLVRPILSAKKSDVLEYCAKNHLEYMTDSTNFELDATRNKIRHILIPEIEKIFPSPQLSSGRLSISAEEYEDFVCESAKKLIGECDTEDSKISISLKKFNSLHIAVRKKLVILMVEKISDIMLEYTHISSIISLSDKAIPHKSIDLPKNILCEIENNRLVFREDNTDADAPVYFEAALGMGLNKIENCHYLIGVFDSKASDIVDPIYTLETYCYLRCDTMNNMLARNKKEGDRILDGGNRKKLKKLMCDKKIPIGARNKLPIIISGDEIIYVPFCAVADCAKATESDEKIKICIYKNKYEEI